MAATEASLPIVVMTTLASGDDGRALVKRLVEERVIACGTIVDGATSIFRWKGQVEESSEALAILKTSRDRWDELKSAVGEHHPYSVPELLALPVEAGLPAYLEWVTEETLESGSDV